MSIFSANETVLWECDTLEVAREHKFWYILSNYWLLAAWAGFVLFSYAKEANEQGVYHRIGEASDGWKLNAALLIFFIATILFEKNAFWRKNAKPEESLKLTDAGFQHLRKDGNTERYDWKYATKFKLEPPVRWRRWLNCPNKLNIVKNEYKPHERRLIWPVPESQLGNLKNVLNGLSKERAT